MLDKQKSGCEVQEAKMKKMHKSPQLTLVNPLCTNGFFLLVWYNRLWMVQLISKYNCISYLKIVSVLANSADPDEMPHHVAFQQGLHYLPKY